MPIEQYTTKEAADLLRVSTQTLLKWIAKGKVPVIHIGHRYWITQETIKDLLTPHEATFAP